MLKYIIKRLILIIPIILGSTVLVFTIMYFTPGDPATMILGNTAEPAAIEALRESMGLNDPYLVRLLRTISGYLRLDFGNSYISGRPIIDDLALRVPNTLLVSLTSIAIGLIIGIPFGIMTAIHHDTWVDYLGMFVALLGISMPGFWFAMLIVSLFSVKLGWLPPFGIGGIKYWIMPIMATSFGGFAGNARMVRSSMLDVLGSDYIVMARAKGIPEREVILKHAFTNALIPVITMVGGSLAGCLGGGMIVETVFAIPGVGYYMSTAISNRDYIVVQGCSVILGTIFTLMMLVTDLVMAAVDPRIKAQFQSGSSRRGRGN